MNRARRNPLTSRDGFSLLEVMVAGGLMSFFAMVLLQVNSLQTRMMTTNDAQMETFTLLFQVQQILSDPVSCSISVGQAYGQVTDLKELTGRSPAKIPVLYRAYKNTLGKYEAVKFLTAGQTVANGVLKITDITLESRPIFDGQLDVVLSIERTRPGVFGGAHTQKRIPINIDLIGMENANAFDGIVCLNPASPGNGGGDMAKKMETAIQSLKHGGSAEDATEKALLKACVAAGGAWVEKEHRCGMAAGGDQNAAALKTACGNSGGQWNAAEGRCGVSVR